MAGPAMSDAVDRIRARFERGLTRMYPVQYTSEAARAVEGGEEVERMRSRAVDTDAEREAQRRAFHGEASIKRGIIDECFAYRRLDEARAEIAGLKRTLRAGMIVELIEEMGRLRAEIARLRAPPEAEGGEG